MPDIKILKQSLSYAALAVLYVAVIGTVMRNADKLFGGGKIEALAPIGILLLLVVSAATMGMLIFGKPVMLYIDGQKREAVSMVVTTIASLAVFTVLVFVIMAVVRV